MEKPENVREFPSVKKCMDHLDIIGADDKTKQIVYMYMECLYRDACLSGEELSKSDK